MTSKAQLGVRNVCFCSDDRGMEWMVVSIYSLLRAAVPTLPLTVNVMHFGPVSEANRRRVGELVERYPFAQLVWLDGERAASRCRADLEKVSGSWCLASWGRLFMAELMPDVDGNVVYLDTDVLVETDLGELFDRDLGANVIAAVRESNVHDGPNFHWRQPADGLRFYFNSGVMVFNLGNFRKTQALERVLSFVRTSGPLDNPDQDALNAVFEHEVDYLPFRWNYTDGWLARQMRFSPHDRYWRGVPSAEILEAIAAPSIIHYLGRQHKPWKANHRSERKRYFRVMAELGLEVPSCGFSALAHDAWYAVCRQVARRRLKALRGKKA